MASPSEGLVIHEVFTWPWLRELSARDGKRVTLGSVPDADWDALQLPGVTAVWLMGVWKRSEVGRAVALDEPSFRSATEAALPDATEADVVGSAYCIRGYEVDRALGGKRGLTAARKALAKRGLRLLLDFVPNHVAPDHPWVEAHPEFFVHGSDEDAARDPAAWWQTSHGPIARGRDPYFPPWPEVVQLDPMSPALRDAVVETLVSIAGQCDGVRCDMAMLFLDDVAERTWQGRLAPRRSEPYWVEVTRRVREKRPDFLFLAEAYWDLEARLLDEGIDLCYDKRLYDRLAHEDAPAIRGHLVADPAWQERMVRFLENHDEPRAATTFPPDRYHAAAVALMTLPGAPLLYRGQREGRRIRLPVHLGRDPVEPVDEACAAFWDRLLRLVADEGLRTGPWQLLAVEGWPDNRSNERLLAWRWARHVVVVNYSDLEADGMVRLGPELEGASWTFHDLYHDASYERDGSELARNGLYVRLAPYDAHVFRIERGATSA
jgi:hypothetical protein